MLALVTTSCGSYQNSSYYDNDGVYGTTDRTNQQSQSINTAKQIWKNHNEYTQQFRAMQEDYAYFTDVDNYESQDQDTAVTVYSNNYSDESYYAGWGTMLLMSL